MRLRTRMLLFIGLPTLVVFILMLTATSLVVRRMVKLEVEREMLTVAQHVAARFDGAFREAAAFAQSTASAIEEAPEIDEEFLFGLLEANIRENRSVYGSAAAFEPGVAVAADARYCPYVHRVSTGYKRMFISPDVYDWYGDEQWQWWHRPKQERRGVWSDPYFDDGAGNVLMVTYSEPFLREGVFAGVTTIDISLPTFRREVGQRILDKHEFFILTRDGTFVYSPEPSDIMNRSLVGLVSELDRPDMVAAAQEVLTGGVGVTELRGWSRGEQRLDGTQWVFHAPIESTDWILVVRIAEDEAMAWADRVRTFAAVALALTAAMIIGAIWFMAGRITRPVERLHRAARDVAKGNLESRVTGKFADDEIGELASSFNQMTADLRANLEHLARERAKRERIEYDLEIARDIQHGLLPRTPPNAPGYQIAGWNKPADQTGGDYFDWLELPDGRVLMTLADVTGHGIGPALIVAVYRAYFRAAAKRDDLAVGRALAEINELMCSDLPRNRFVTAVIGLLDPASNSMSLMSAGQGPLLMYRAETGAVERWPADAMPLGILPHVEFTDVRQVTFQPGDLLALTTDGFFEWANAADEQFGVDRLASFVRDHASLEPSMLIARLVETVQSHVGDVAQPDDLTAIVIRRTGTTE